MDGEFVPWVHNDKKRVKYYTVCILSYPFWIKRTDFLHLAEEVKRLDKETGIKHSLDHIIPLRHPLVSGLTVPWNLRVITLSANSKKSNKFDQLLYEQIEYYIVAKENPNG
jgi:hypothetical protein